MIYYDLHKVTVERTYSTVVFTCLSICLYRYGAPACDVLVLLVEWVTAHSQICLQEAAVMFIDGKSNSGSGWVEENGIAIW
jgi:hypothetical protein